MRCNSRQTTRNIRFLCCLASLTALISQTEGQAPRFLWAKAFPTTHSEAVAVATDRYGNTYVTGYFRDRMEVDGIVLTNGGVFILKLDRNGAVVWARQAGTNRCEGRGIGLDSEGNPIVICDFYNLGSAPLPVAGTNVSGRIILAKYDAEGNGLWARRIASGPLSGLGLFEVGPSGDSCGIIYVYGPGTTVMIGDTPVSAPFTSWRVLIRCDADGNVAWFRIPEGPSGPNSQGPALGDVAIDRAGAVYVCGSFSNSVSLPPTNLVAAGVYDTLLAKYNANGDLAWARQAGGPLPFADDWAVSIALDREQNCVMTGFYVHAADFGEITLTNSVPTNYCFMAKYQPDGALLWAKTVAQDRSSAAWITTDLDDNIYYARNRGMNWMKLDSSGEVQWSRSGPGFFQWDLSSDGMGHCNVAGAISGSTGSTHDFDGIVLTATHLPFAVVAKLDTTTRPRLSISGRGDAMELSWSILAGGCHVQATENLLDPDSWLSNSVSITASGAVHTVTVPQSGLRRYYRLAK